MRKWLRPDWRARLLDLFACFLIPLYTLLFTHDTRWFTTNFSVIAAARDQRHGFFLWGMLVGVYLLCVLLPVGLILDTSSLFLMTSDPLTVDSALAIYLAGISANVIHAAATAFFLFLIGPVVLEKLERVKVKYGLME